MRARDEGDWWRESRRCAGMSADFFHQRRGSPAERAAQDFCYRGCLVRAECLAFGMEAEEGTPDRLLHGVYGGLSPRDRIEVRGCIDE